MTAPRDVIADAVRAGVVPPSWVGDRGRWSRDVSALVLAALSDAGYVVSRAAAPQGEVTDAMVGAAAAAFREWTGKGNIGLVRYVLTAALVAARAAPQGSPDEYDET